MPVEMHTDLSTAVFPLKLPDGVLNMQQATGDRSINYILSFYSFLGALHSLL